jgi:transcription elongation factor S-II
MSSSAASYHETCTKLREHSRQYFEKQFTKSASATEDSTIQKNMAANLEIGIFNYAIKEATHRKIVKSWDNRHFQQLYKDRLRTIYCNLGEAMIALILSGEVKPQEFAFMTHQEMCPEKWTELIDKKRKREDSRNQTAVQCSTSLFTCKRCTSKNCTYYELQIRSADEPATIFVSCLDCGKHWRV